MGYYTDSRRQEPEIGLLRCRARDRQVGKHDPKPNQNRLPKAKDAAKKFVDNLLIEDSDTRIAVVTFNKTSDQVSDFKGLDQKSELKRAIDNIQATGERIFRPDCTKLRRF